MGNPDLRSNGEDIQVSGLSRHSNLLDRLKKVGGNSIPRTPTKSLESSIFSPEGSNVKGEKGCYIG